MTIRVASYFLTVTKHRDSKRSLVPLSKFDGATDLFNVLLNIVSSYSVHRNLSLVQKTFQIKTTPTNSRAISGFANIGTYGRASSLIDAPSGKITYNKKRNESDPQPFYFHLAVPIKGDKAILCIQETGIYGVKGLVEDVLCEEFTTLYPDFHLNISSLLLADELEAQLKSNLITEVVMERHEISGDIADRLGNGKKPVPGIVRTTICPTDKSFFKKSGLISIVRQKQKGSFTFMSEQYDDIVAVARIGNSSRSLRLSKSDGFAAYIDITDNVMIGVDGYPTEASLKTEFVGIVGELAKRSGIKI
jgi:hypothetical protein